MDLTDRIARRRASRLGRDVLVDHEELSPVTHRPNPVGRGPVLERLLDKIEPVFDTQLPPSFAVVGPFGSGTSAVIRALFDALNDRVGNSNRAIGTTTRAGGTITWFVYIDGRRVDSPFAFYRALLSGVAAESVPESGVGTDYFRDRIREQLSRPDRRAVVAIDHHDEPGALPFDRVQELLEPVAESVSAVAVGTREPADWDGETVDIPAYRQHELVDILTDRASRGIAPGGVDHESIRRIAAWADGNAHNALAALFGAAMLANNAGVDRIAPDHVEAAMADVPTDGVHADRALSLSETRREVLLALTESEIDELPIREVAARLADKTSLTEGTVTRVLYELADAAVLERVAIQASGSGRRPSTVEARFPTIVFRSLAGVDR
ncbi:AAA family ATPase [Halobacteria archaeon AArc-dxtr1]|nr:AAA family ATPase [Halobacteria archaeon AArc-dxtr1]